MKSAILLVTRVPNMEQVEHFRSMVGDGYDVVIVADDNTKQYSAPGVQIVQADTATCESEGWKGSSLLIKPGAIAWDKLMY